MADMTDEEIEAYEEEQAAKKKAAKDKADQEVEANQKVLDDAKKELGDLTQEFSQKLGEAKDKVDKAQAKLNKSKAKAAKYADPWPPVVSSSAMISATNPDLARNDAMPGSDPLHAMPGQQYVPQG